MHSTAEAAFYLRTVSAVMTLRVSCFYTTHCMSGYAGLDTKQLACSDQMQWHTVLRHGERCPMALHCGLPRHQDENPSHPLSKGYLEVTFIHDLRSSKTQSSTHAYLLSVHVACLSCSAKLRKVNFIMTSLPYHLLIMPACIPQLGQLSVSAECLVS